MSVNALTQGRRTCESENSEPSLRAALEIGAEADCATAEADCATFVGALLYRVAQARFLARRTAIRTITALSLSTSRLP
jgi:hypothetical protein